MTTAGAAKRAEKLLYDYTPILEVALALVTLVVIVFGRWGAATYRQVMG